MPVFTEFHYNQVIITFIFKAIAEIVFMNVFFSHGTCRSRNPFKLLKIMLTILY